MMEVAVVVVVIIEVGIEEARHFLLAFDLIDHGVIPIKATAGEIINRDTMANISTVVPEEGVALIAVVGIVLEVGGREKRKDT